MDKSLDSMLSKFAKNLEEQTAHLRQKKVETPVAEANKMMKIHILENAAISLTAFSQQSDKVKVDKLDNLIRQITHLKNSLSEISHIGKFNKLFNTPSSTQKIFDQFLKDASAYLPDKKEGKPSAGPR